MNSSSGNPTEGLGSAKNSLIIISPLKVCLKLNMKNQFVENYGVPEISDILLVVNVARTIY